MQTRLLRIGILITLAACADKLPAGPASTEQAALPKARYEPAPRPFVHYVPRTGPVGVLEIPLPPKMPLGTGAVPVSASPVRGSIVTGYKGAF